MYVNVLCFQRFCDLYIIEETSIRCAKKKNKKNKEKSKINKQTKHHANMLGCKSKVRRSGGSDNWEQ